MRLTLTLVCLLMSAVTVNLLSAGEISPGLAALMAENSDNDPLTVLVVMHDGLDVKSLDLSLHEQKVGLATRHQIVIESLREAASSAQKDLLADLENASSSSRILDY